MNPEEFSGTGTSASFTVEWSQVSSLVEKAEEETGIVPGSYLLTALVRVGLEGEGAAAEDFVAELPMELTRTELVIPSDVLKIASDATEERQTLVPNRLELIGLSLPVSRATVVAATALGVLLAWIALFSWRTLRRLGGGELARLRLRYGQLIVPVTDANAEHERTVEVASMADLVTLARKAEQMVFYASSNHGSHRFFVPDGNVVYEFWVGAHGARGST